MEVFKEGSKKNLCGTKSLRINCRLQLFLSVHISPYVISVIIYMSLHANISLLVGVLHGQSFYSTLAKSSNQDGKC